MTPVTYIYLILLDLSKKKSLLCHFIIIFSLQSYVVPAIVFLRRYIPSTIFKFEEVFLFITTFSRLSFMQLCSLFLSSSIAHCRELIKRRRGCLGKTILSSFTTSAFRLFLYLPSNNSTLGTPLCLHNSTIHVM